MEDGGLAGGQRGWGKCLNISVAGPCGGDGMGVSGDAAEREDEKDTIYLLIMCGQIKCGH